MTQRYEVRAIGLVMISFALVASANGEEKKVGCDFGAYRPLKIATPIRGGHENLVSRGLIPYILGKRSQKGSGGASLCTS